MRESRTLYIHKPIKNILRCFVDASSTANPLQLLSFLRFGGFYDNFNFKLDPPIFVDGSRNRLQFNVREVHKSMQTFQAMYLNRWFFHHSYWVSSLHQLRNPDNFTFISTGIYYVHICQPRLASRIMELLYML